MLFLVRLLHTPNGGLLRNKVVVVDDGVVKDIYSFSHETHSMLLLDDVYLSSVDSLRYLEDIKTISLSENGRLYAYRLMGEELFLLGY